MSGFAFGASSGNPGFAFGAQPNPTTSANPIGGFGAPVSQQPQSSFGFGAPASSAPVSSAALSFGTTTRLVIS